MVSAVRGATTIEFDQKDQIISRVCEMVDVIFKENNLKNESVISILFSITEDLQSINPAAALRSRGGYGDIPLFCSQEPKSVNALPRAVRVVITWNGTGLKGIPCYMYGAKKLRPDLIK